MPAVSLNQRSGALLALRVSARVFLGSVRFLFVLLAGATVQFSGFHNVYCPNASCLGLGLSFYPLEQAPNLVFYAMSKLRDSNERFNLNRGILNPKPGEKRAPLLPKNSSADWRLEIGLGLVSFFLFSGSASGLA